MYVSLRKFRSKVPKLNSCHRTYKSKNAQTVYAIRFFLGIFESVGEMRSESNKEPG